MACSEAKLLANLRNAALSTGPKTAEGKSHSRANALKHGLTGEGVVLREEDELEVEQARRELEAEFQPTGRMGRILVKRIAVMSVRLERCFEQEVAERGHRRHVAVRLYDENQLKAVETAFQGLAASPDIQSRKLETTPEGVDRKLEAWLAIREDLELSPSRFGYHHWQVAENLVGKSTEDVPFSRFGALCHVIWGQPSYLEPEGMDLPARVAWAQDQLRTLIDAEVARLRKVRASFDPVELARERARAVPRANFDASPAAILVAKYEAAAERSMLQALAELRKVDPKAQVVESKEPTARLASFSPPPAKATTEVQPVAAVAQASPSHLPQNPSSSRKRRDRRRRGVGGAA
jgi:hypothetical protein